MLVKNFIVFDLLFSSCPGQRHLEFPDSRTAGVNGDKATANPVRSNRLERHYLCQASLSS